MDPSGCIHGRPLTSPCEDCRASQVAGIAQFWADVKAGKHDSTKACKCPDTPRYKGLGNAVTVPVAEWIARRIRDAETLASPDHPV